MAELTLEELRQIGAKPPVRTNVPVREPTAVPASEGFSFDDVRAMGARTVDPDPEVGALETFGTSYADAGTLGFADELGAAMQGGLAALTPGMSARETYRQARDENRIRSDAGTRQNPWASGGGTALGIGASLLFPYPVLRGPPGAIGRLATGALTGAGYGAAGAAGRSDADLTKGEFEKFGLDLAGNRQFDAAAQNARRGEYLKAALNVAGAGVPGGIASGLVASGAAEGLRTAGPSIARYAIDQGRKVLTNGADSLSKRQPVRAEAVREAIESGAIRTGGTTEGAHATLESLAAQQGDKYAEIIEMLAAHGVEGPVARDLAYKIFARAAEREPNVMNKAIPQTYLEAAGQIEGKAGSGGRLGLSQTEQLKQDLQKTAKYGRVEETPINEVNREVASIVREANEQAIEAAGRAAGEGSKVGQLAADFVPTKQRMGRLIEARDAAERGTARALQRNGSDLPGVLELGAAMATNNPFMLALKPLSNILKRRGPSTLASGGLRLSNALRDGVAAPNAAKYAEQFAGSLVGSEMLRPSRPAYADDSPSDSALPKAMRQRKGRH